MCPRRGGNIDRQKEYCGEVVEGDGGQAGSAQTHGFFSMVSLTLLLSLQQFPTMGFSREAKGSARAHLELWDGNLLSCLSVLQGGAQVPHCAEIFTFPLKSGPCQPRTF